MARIRTIKPEFWTDEDLAGVSEPALILAASLLNHADDEGFFRAHHGLIKAACFPLREPSLSIQGMFSELSEIGYARFFKGNDGKQYGRVVNFLRHQKINRPTPSKIKQLIPITEHSGNVHGELTEDSFPEQGKEQGKEHGKIPRIQARV